MDTTRISLLIATLFFVAFSDQGYAQPPTFTSPSSRTILVELFTSEGCSSCPPAEKYLNSYTSKPELWTKYIPLAFHVDYWDYLGWKDPYADASYSQRQRQYAKINRARTVYTPGFFINGRPWRPGFFTRSDPEITQQQVGTLELSFTENRVHASFKPIQLDAKKFDLNFAVLGMMLSTEIQAGENEGRTSQHEFVVHTLKKYQGNNNQWDFQLPKLTDIPGKKLAFAAWVSASHSPIPLQAVGGYMPESVAQLYHH